MLRCHLDHSVKFLLRDKFQFQQRSQPRYTNVNFTVIHSLFFSVFHVCLQIDGQAAACNHTNSRHPHLCFSCCLLFRTARIYRPLPGLKSSPKDSFGFFSPEVRITPHRTSTSGSYPAALIGCDGSRNLTPLQRSTCDYAEVSLLLPYVFASPHIPCGFHGCGFILYGISSSVCGSLRQERKRKAAIQL